MPQPLLSLSLRSWDREDRKKLLLALSFISGNKPDLEPSHGIIEFRQFHTKFQSIRILFLTSYLKKIKHSILMTQKINDEKEYIKPNYLSLTTAIHPCPFQ